MSGSSPSEVLSRSGWCRSVGGVNPYLAIFSRSGASQAEIERALAERKILELPSARGCTYVLPESDFQIGLAVGKGSREPEMNVARKLGVTDEEIERLGQAILRALESGDKDPATLKLSVGEAARSLGEEGKKKGLSTTLPLALGQLQAKGLILRQPINGRLDSQRYAYTLWHGGPSEVPCLAVEDAQTAVAERFFRWIGPATIAEFATLLAISGKAAKGVLAKLPLVPVEPDSEYLIYESELDSFHAFVCPEEPSIRLVGSMDNLFHLSRNVLLNLDDCDLVQCQAGEKGLIPLGQVQELSNNAIVDRGRIVGLWEFDPDRGEIVWHSFVSPFREMRDQIAKTEAFIRDQLGDARTFSLDSPQSRRPKIEALRSPDACCV